MQNEQIVQEIQAGHNVNENLALLYQQNEPFIYKIARKFTGNEDDLEDLMQESYFAIVKATESYDVEQRDASFMTYAAYKIWDYCNKYMRKNRGIYIPDYIIQRIFSYRKLLKDYKAEYGETPTDTYIMEHMKLDKKQYDRLMKEVAILYVHSIEEKINSNEDALTIGETVPSEEDVEENYLQKEEEYLKGEFGRKLWEQVENLKNSKQSLVVKRIFKEGKSLVDIAHELCMSRQRVHQIEKVALSNLRKIAKVKEIAEYYGYTSSSAYNYTLARFKNTRTSCVEHLVLKHLEHQEEEQALDLVFNDIMECL